MFWRYVKFAIANLGVAEGEATYPLLSDPDRGEQRKLRRVGRSGGIIFYTSITPTTPSIATIKPITPSKPKYLS